MVVVQEWESLALLAELKHYHTLDPSHLKDVLRDCVGGTEEHGKRELARLCEVLREHRRQLSAIFRFYRWVAPLQ